MSHVGKTLRQLITDETKFCRGKPACDVNGNEVLDIRGDEAIAWCLVGGVFAIHANEDFHGKNVLLAKLTTTIRELYPAYDNGFGIISNFSDNAPWKCINRVIDIVSSKEGATASEDVLQPN